MQVGAKVIPGIIMLCIGIFGFWFADAETVVVGTKPYFRSMFASSLALIIAMMLVLSAERDSNHV